MVNMAAHYVHAFSAARSSNLLLTMYACFLTRTVNDAMGHEVGSCKTMAQPLATFALYMSVRLGYWYWYGGTSWVSPGRPPQRIIKTKSRQKARKAHSNGV
jgi:hypothetical protein